MPLRVADDDDHLPRNARNAHAARRYCDKVGRKITMHDDTKAARDLREEAYARLPPRRSLPRMHVRTLPRMHASMCDASDDLI